MQLILDLAGWVMIVSGLLTMTMVQAVFAPQAAMNAQFGQALEGPAAEIVVRNWGLLVTLIGAALVYAGWTGTLTVPVLLLAIVSKAAFILLVLSQGKALRGGQARLSIAVDGVFAVLFALFLIAHATA